MIKKIIEFLSKVKCKLQCCFKSNCTLNDSIIEKHEIIYKFSTEV
jgi:hypothetical protein